MSDEYDDDPWELVATAPHACCVLAARFDENCGEWIYGVVLSPPSHPFTHWQPLPDPPRQNDGIRSSLPVDQWSKLNSPA